MTEEYLTSLVCTGGLEISTDILVERLNNILTTAATECGAKKPKPCEHQSKKPWSKELKPLTSSLMEKTLRLKQMEEQDPILTMDVKVAKREFRSAQHQLATI